MVSDRKPLVIPVFIPHSGCPHQCAFCNQSILTDQKKPLPDQAAIQSIIELYSRYKGRRKSVELAFFGGNFLGLPPGQIIQLLNWIQPYINEKKIQGIRFSTRPDTINRKLLDLIEPFSISTVELGVQSMNDDVLFAAGRGHTSMDSTRAVDLLKKYPFKIGVQMMAGLPGENEAGLLDSTRKAAALSPDFARIYPLMVLKGSLMEKWYNSGKYKALSLDESVRLVKKMFLIFTAAQVEVIRMGLQASDMMEDKSMVIAGPWHPAFGHLVLADLLYDRVCNKIDALAGRLKSGCLELRIHPRSVSRMRGDKNANVKKLKHRYPQFEFLIQQDENTPVEQVDISITRDKICGS